MQDPCEIMALKRRCVRRLQAAGPSEAHAVLRAFAARTGVPGAVADDLHTQLQEYTDGGGEAASAACIERALQVMVSLGVGVVMAAAQGAQ